MLATYLHWRCSSGSYLQLQPIEQAAPPAAKPDATHASADQVMQLIKDRRSVFPKDFTGELVGRYAYCTLSSATVTGIAIAN